MLKLTSLLPIAIATAIALPVSAETYTVPENADELNALVTVMFWEAVDCKSHVMVYGNVKKDSCRKYFELAYILPHPDTMAEMVAGQYETNPGSAIMTQSTMESLLSEAREINYLMGFSD